MQEGAVDPGVLPLTAWQVMQLASKPLCAVFG
jgi:hypothetical protein